MSPSERIEFLENQNSEYFTKIINLEMAVKALNYELGIKQSEIDELKDLMAKDEELTPTERAEVKRTKVYKSQLDQINSRDKKISLLKKTNDELIIRLIREGKEK